VRGAIRPRSTRFRVGGSVLRSVQPLVPRVCLSASLAEPAPSGSTGTDSSLSRTAPPTAPTPRRSTVLQLPHACCDRRPAVASHHRQGSRTPRGARSPRPTSHRAAGR
jgi:hypothetical protein